MTWVAFLSSVPVLLTRKERCIRQKAASTALTAVLISYGAEDFEIRRAVGRQGFYEITDWEYYSEAGRDPTMPKRTTQASEIAIRLYEGRIVARTVQYNSRVLLKEFLEPALQIAVREAEAYKKLYEGFGDKFDPDKVPVATLLGSFQADDSFATREFREKWKKMFPNVGESPRPDSPWLVFRWEGTLTAVNYPSFEQQKTAIEKFFVGDTYRATTGYLRRLMRKALEALQYLHASGLTHGSIGLASLMVNTLEERFAPSLEVKLRDLGFSKAVSDVDEATLAKARAAKANTPSEIARFLYADDIYGLGYAFLELIFAKFSSKGPGPLTSQDSFKRTFEDVYACDVEQMREFCRAEEDWNNAVRFLDERDKAGWYLIKDMLRAKIANGEKPSWPSTSELLESTFLK